MEYCFYFRKETDDFRHFKEAGGKLDKTTGKPRDKQTDNILKLYKSVVLDVDFDEKDDVKEMGAYWDKARYKWIIPQYKTALFEKYIKSKVDDGKKKYYLLFPKGFDEIKKKYKARYDKTKKLYYVYDLKPELELFLYDDTDDETSESEEED